MTPTLGGRRRPLVIALGVLVVALLVALGVTQVRADRAAAVRADEVRAAAAARVAAEAARDAAAREVGAVHAARHGQAQARELAATLASVAPREAAAQEVLDASAGKVADDAVRAALQSALDGLRGGVAAAAQGTVTSAALLAAADAVDAASASVTAARAEWEAAAAKAPARAAPTATARPTVPVEEPAPATAGRPTDAAGNVLWVTSVPTADGDGSNGDMPMSAMCRIPWGTDQLGYAQYLRCDAADALTELEAAFRATFGESIAMDLTYRSYADQVAMKQALGPIAAKPGTSSHGLGTALDVQEWPDVYGFGTARYEWLVANGPTYGWYAPARVRADAAYPEYWHFEYGPGRTS
jgi:hypothetical protein